MLHQYIKVRKKAHDKQAGENEGGKNVFHVLLYHASRQSASCIQLFLCHIHFVLCLTESGLISAESAIACRQPFMVLNQRGSVGKGKGL